MPLFDLRTGRHAPGRPQGSPPSAGGLERVEPLAASLPPLLVEAERVAATVTQGLHGRRRAGVGETFWQYRRYEPGDRPQSIDWRRSARADPVFVRELEWEAAQSVWLWADASGSMDYTSIRGLPTKTARARLLVLALAVMLDRAGERFALLDADPMKARPPGGGRHALRRLAEALDRGSVRPWGEPPALPVPRHAHVVLIGDFLAPLPETAARLRALVDRGARGALVQVLDPAEEAFPFRGRLHFDGLEGEDGLLAERAEALRAAYRERLQDHRAGLAALARFADWRLLVHHTDQPPTPVLMALYLAMSGGRVPKAW